MKNAFLLTLLLISLNTWAQEVTTSAKTQSFPDKKFALGILGNHQAIGIQAEYLFAKRLGLKMIGTKVLGYERSKEYGYATIGLLTYYIPTNNRLIEPVIGIGSVYALYHWKLGSNSGNIRDFNIGGGFGTNFRVSNRFRTGINIFLANNFRTDYAEETMFITGRKLLVLPTLTFEILL